MDVPLPSQSEIGMIPYKKSGRRQKKEEEGNPGFDEKTGWGGGYFGEGESFSISLRNLSLTFWSRTGDETSDGGSDWLLNILRNMRSCFL